MNEISQRYQIKEKIGSGGMGTVYRTWDRELERDVALKWLPAYLSADETFSERFRREVRVVAHLEHQHIVPIYDVGESEGRPFIIMRLLDGGTLRNKVEQGNFNLAELVKATEQIADALAAAHARQIIHRDIKPGNILFDNHGSAFLSDFGIAKVLDSGTQLTGTGFIGTPAYMSPEQFTGQNIDGRSDQYSLATVVYETLTGALPFEGNTAQMMYQHINVAPSDINLDKHPIPTGLNPILQKSLAKDPADRYANITDFSTAMTIAMRMEPTTSSVLLPVIIGAPPPVSQPRPTPRTEIDTALEEEAVSVDDDYRAGLEALALGEWAAALAAFNRVLDIAPDYGNAVEFSRQAQANLEETTAIKKTRIEEVPAAAAAVAIDKTIIEPTPIITGHDSPATVSEVPPSTPQSAVPPPTQEGGRKIPLWVFALLALLLLAGGVFVISQVLGGAREREPSLAESGGPAAAAVILDTETPLPATETPKPDPTSTPLPNPTSLPEIVAPTESVPENASQNKESGEETGEQAAQSIVKASGTDPAETSPPTAEPTTGPPTEEPTEVPAIVRVIVSSANLRRGPGTIYETIGAILADQEAIVLGTSRDRTWYNIELDNGTRAWLAASVTEALDAGAVSKVSIAATIPAAPTFTPVPPTATPFPTLPPPSLTPDSGGGGGNDGGGDGGGGSDDPKPPPKYTAEPP